MDWMDAIRLSAVAALGLLLPQALGFAGYRWTRRKAAPLKISFILIPPLVFFVIADAYWTFQANSIRAAGYRVCGAFGAAAALSTMFGTLFHLVAAAIVLALLSLWWKRQDRKAKLQPIL
jgi:hypothetical protein